MAGNPAPIENMQRGLVELFSGTGEVVEDAMAAYSQGQRLMHGGGGARDLSAAAQRFRFAAQRGMPEAQAILGQMHLTGAGVPLDYRESFRWSRLAAARGNVGSMRVLSGLFARGYGVSRSLVMSYALQTVIESIDPSLASESHGYRNELGKLMSGADISMAGELAGKLSVPGDFLATFDQFVAALR